MSLVEGTEFVFAAPASVPVYESTGGVHVGGVAGCGGGGASEYAGGRMAEREATVSAVVR